MIATFRRHESELRPGVIRLSPSSSTGAEIHRPNSDGAVLEYEEMRVLAALTLSRV